MVLWNEQVKEIIGGFNHFKVISIYYMEVGDLVWVRYAVFHPDGRGNFGDKWKLGVIIKDDEYQAGLYKIHVLEYDVIQKHFLNDIRIFQKVLTIYDDLVEDLKCETGK